MQLISGSFHDSQPIPAEFAFAVPDPQSHTAFAANRNPHFAWLQVPDGVGSFVLTCHDPDAPSLGDDVNQDDREVPASLPRVDFYHWTLWDIPATTTQIGAGSQSEGVTAHGKSGPAAPHGYHHGLNDYTSWFAGDEQLAGAYYGYDGPCPPWNDSVIHRYVFTVYALADESLVVEGELTGPYVLAALSSARVLATASLSGTYTLNPRLRS